MNLSCLLVTEIENLARRYDVERVLLFGSRARGDAHSRSDIDLAVFVDPTFQKKGYISADVEELPTLLKIDLVFIDDALEPEFRKRIIEEGVVIYERPHGEA